MGNYGGGGWWKEEEGIRERNEGMEGRRGRLRASGKSDGQKIKGCAKREVRKKKKR